MKIKLRKKIIGLCGSYDGQLHKGHKNRIDYALSLGFTTIILVPDIVIKRNKNRDPIFSFENRKKNLLKYNNTITVIEGPSNYNKLLPFIIALNFDCFILGKDQISEIKNNNNLYHSLQKNGIKVIIKDRTPNISTTQLYFK